MPDVDPPTEPTAEPLEQEDFEVARYRVLSGTAVAALVFGVLSILAVLDPLAWTIPVVAVVLAAAALLSIARREGELIGRRAALIGLALALAFGGYAVSHWITGRMLLQRQARQFGMAWFEFLREGQPQKALQLTVHPNQRQPLNQSLWRYYGKDWTRRDELTTYVSRPLVRTLLELGELAEVRFYENEEVTGDRYRDVVKQVYAVTYEESGNEKTFFVRLRLERLHLDEGQAAAWRLGFSEGGVRPDSMGPKGEVKPALPEPKGTLRTDLQGARRPRLLSS